MKTLITFRHGCYDGSGNLSPIGAEQIVDVAKMIQKINMAQLPITLLCSTAPRAKQGGDILIKRLHIPEELAIFNENLWQDNHHSGDFNQVMKLIDENFREDAILLCLSHLDTVSNIARYVAGKFDHKTKHFGESSYGCGWFINHTGCSSFPR